MAIYSKRTIQRLINENSAFLTPEQISKHIRELNKDDKSSIGYEWEVVLLNVFSKLGEVIHEKDFGGSKKPDLYFSQKTNSNSEFIADITTISDEGLEKENPYEYFADEFKRFLKKYDLTPGGFHIDVDGNNLGEYGDSKMKLNLPPKNQISKFIKEKLTSFVTKVKQKPSDPSFINIDENGVKLKITYDPKNNRYFFGGHPSYSTPYSLTRNPIFNRLHNKADQLSKCGFKGKKGIVLCDGGCDTLNKDYGFNFSNYNQKQIIKHFFERNSSISFVLTVSAESQNIPLKKRTSYTKTCIFTNFNTEHQINKDTIHCLESLTNYLPKPINTAINARYHFKGDNRHNGLSFHGGSTMKSNEIKISSRSLVELLAGTIEQKKFLEDHGFITSERTSVPTNFFLNQLAQGRMIEGMEVEKVENEDDDWIVFKFGQPDPAISQYTSIKER